MKKKDLKMLVGKKTKELEKILSEKRLEILKNQAEVYSGKEKNLKKAKNLRKEIAQILTIIKENELTKKESEAKEN